MILTPLSAFVIALTLYNNNTSNALITDTRTAVQKYDVKNSEQYQRQNKDVCEQYRDSIYTDSESLEESQYQFPTSFMIMSPDEAKQNVKNSLKYFNENGCYQNNFIHYSDRDLIKKLEKDLNK